MKDPTYKIIRFFKKDFESKIIATGLTLEQAKKHCSSIESSSETTTDTLMEKFLGPWFDGFKEE